MTFTLLDPQTFAFLGLYVVVGLAIEGMLAARIFDGRGASRRGVGSAWVRSRSDSPAASRRATSSSRGPRRATTCRSPRSPATCRSTTRSTPATFQLKLGLLDRSAGARAGRRQLASPAAGRRAELPPGAARLRAARAVAQRPLRRDRRHARRRAHARGRPADGGVRQERRPVRPRTTAGATRRGPGCSRSSTACPRPYWDAFADAVRPPILMEMFRLHDYQLGAVRQLGRVHRGSGSIGRRWPACRTCACARTRRIPAPGTAGRTSR